MRIGLQAEPGGVRTHLRFEIKVVNFRTGQGVVKNYSKLMITLLYFSSENGSAITITIN